MGRPEGIEAVLAAKFRVLLPHLDERQRRLAIGAEVLSLGHGGIRLVAAAAGVQEGAVSRGAAELDSGQAVLGWVRRPGGGRKKAVVLGPGLRPVLLALVEPDERGDLMSSLRWTTESTRRLAVELTRQCHRVSADTVAGLLREEGFSLQANAKTIEGAQHPDRDAQFRYSTSRHSPSFPSCLDISACSTARADQSHSPNSRSSSTPPPATAQMGNDRCMRRMVSGKIKKIWIDVSGPDK